MSSADSSIRRVSSAQVPEPAPNTWSNCLAVGDVVYVSGMIARGPDGRIQGDDEYAQARLIFVKIRRLLEAAGAAMADVVKLGIYVTDIMQREEVWRARAEFFQGDFPTSALVEVRALATPEVRVEVEAIAHRGAGAR